RKVLTCPSGKAAANAAERGVVFIGFYKKVPRAERGRMVLIIFLKRSLVCLFSICEARKWC
ncbi:hypothetical protein, partial [Dialister hominis]|uniref:hypothetical protein n=1 Tax=Dialister hominis TaxID=2582419 RepID=UPI003FEDA8BC